MKALALLVVLALAIPCHAAREPMPVRQPPIIVDPHEAFEPIIDFWTWFVPYLRALRWWR